MSTTEQLNKAAVDEFYESLGKDTGQIEVIQKPQNLLTAIERAATNPSVDVTKLRELIEIAREERAYNARIAWNSSMVRAQAAIGRVAPDATNKQTGSDYAKLQALDRAVRPVYTAEGFSLSFSTGDAPEGNVRVLCTVSHADGHDREYMALVPSDGKGPKGNDVQTKTHAFGSGMTYGKRQLIKAIFNIAEGTDEDDDGNGADGRDTSATDAIYDKIEISQSVAELKKVQQDVENASGKDKRNLIATFNARMRKLKAEAANAQP